MSLWCLTVTRYPVYFLQLIDCDCLCNASFQCAQIYRYIISQCTWRMFQSVSIINIMYYTVNTTMLQCQSGVTRYYLYSIQLIMFIECLFDASIINFKV